MAVGNFNAYGVERVGANLATTGLTGVLTVPDDDRYTVKCILAYNSATTATSVTVSWIDGDTSTTYTLFDQSIAGTTGNDFLDGGAGPLVLKGGDTLQLQASAAGVVDVTVSYMALGRLSGQT